jgi:hypothetical protein
LPARSTLRSIVPAGLFAAVLAIGAPSGAYAGAPDLGPHQFSIVDAGLAVNFTGGMSAGTAAELRKVLLDNPAVQVIHLNSPGGLVGEARQFFELIQRRQLITTTDRYCLSACALAFLAGRQRYLAPGAKLGFHSESSPTASDDQVEAMEQLDKQTMLTMGIPQPFIDKAFGTPKDRIWIPKVSELEDAHIIDGVTDEYVLDTGPAADSTGGKSTARAGGSDLPAIEETPDGITIYRGSGAN